MEGIPFFKMHGAGNDFILIDNRDGRFSGTERELFAQWCRRPFGLGADGLLLIEPAGDVDFVLRYYNADGRPAAMCGNGARCGVWAAHQLGLCGREARFRVFDRLYRARLLGKNRVQLSMGNVRQILQKDQLTELGDLHLGLEPLGVWDTGVPHLVLHSQIPLDQVNMAEWGPRYRFHALFDPQGVNVNLVEVATPGVMRVRVYERGVEKETLSCGTGAVACAMAAHQCWAWPFPIRVESAGGTLEVALMDGEGQLALIGPVYLVSRGYLNRPPGGEKSKI